MSLDCQTSITGGDLPCFPGNFRLSDKGRFAVEGNGGAYVEGYSQQVVSHLIPVCVFALQHHVFLAVADDMGVFQSYEMNSSVRRAL